MATKDRDIWQPQWVALPILDFVRLVHQFGDDTESLGQWVKRFSDDLLFCNTDSEDELTRRLLEDAKEKVQKLSSAGKKGGKASAKARKQKQKSQEVAGNGNAPDESTTSLEEFNDQETDKVSTNNPSGDNTANVPPSHGHEDGTIDNPATPAGSSHPAGNTPPQFVINHNQRHRPQKPQVNSLPRSSEDVRLFALDKNLDIDDARMWYQMNFVDRPGCDKDGVAINNWKGHCTAYCKAEAERRKAG